MVSRPAKRLHHRIETGGMIADRQHECRYCGLASSYIAPGHPQDTEAPVHMCHTHYTDVLNERRKLGIKNRRFGHLFK